VSERARKNFTETLRDVRGGQVIDDLTEHFRELVSKVLETGGAGELHLKLKVKRFSKGEGNTLLISDDIKTKLPVSEKGETILFATADGDLQRNDPRQPRLTGMERPAANVVPMTPATASTPEAAQV
jgi:hypothetical protein